jgi:hypothetical protein
MATLETIWRSSHRNAAVDQSEWCFFRVRPDNFPIHRLIALSYIVGRYYQFGLLKGILNLVRETPEKKGHRWIEDGIMITGSGCWDNRFDFRTGTKENPSLLGRSKAAEIIVNILLPFTCACGKLYSESELEARAIKLYTNYPGLENNQLLRYMRQQLSVRPDFSLTALQQQGLIHIFKNYCRQRNCGVCTIMLSQS